MHEAPFLHHLRRGWKHVALFAMVGALVGIVASFALPLPSGGRLEYSSTMRLLVLQNDTAVADAYAAIKSSERVADSLASIVYSTSFFERVLQPQHGIDASVFKPRESVRRRQWSRMVSAQVGRGSGILEVTVYHKRPAEATKIAKAVAAVLTSSAAEYVGGRPQIVVVDSPLESRFPVRPNVPANLFTGLFLGLMLGAAHVFLRHTRRHFFG